MAFAELIATRKLCHPAHRQLTEHVLNAAARFVGERWRFVEPRGRERAWIDAAIAACMACDVAAADLGPQVSVYEERFAA